MHFAVTMIYEIKQENLANNAQTETREPANNNKQ
jgi:hypothetical protein